MSVDDGRIESQQGASELVATRPADTFPSSTSEFSELPVKDEISHIPPEAFLPQLTYNLHSKRHKLLIAWAIILLDFCIGPIVLFYALWYGSSLRHGVSVAVFTSVCGVLSPIGFFLNVLKLIRKDPKYRPDGATRPWLDFFHMSLTLDFTMMVILLIIGTAPHEPILPLISIPVAAVFLAIGASLLILQLAHNFNFTLPVRISSTAAGEPIRSALYYYVEDIVAVEGNGCLPYRKQLAARYDASKKFRTMLNALSWAWSIGLIGIAAVCAAVIFGVSPQDTVQFGVGWGVPFVWAHLWGLGSMIYVHYCLKSEWDEARARAQAASSGTPHPQLEKAVEASV